MILKAVNNIYKYSVISLASVAISIIVMISAISTCYMESGMNELTFFTKDNLFLNVLALALFIAALFCIKKIGWADKINDKLANQTTFKKTKNVLLAVITIIGLIWVLGTQFVPGSDQMDVMYSAYKLRVQNYNMLQPGGYLDMWGNQVGLTLIEYALASIVGDFNYLFVQVLNVFGITLLYKKLVDIWNRFGASRLSQVCILVCGIIFFPFIMYASFVYGTIWSVALALVAFDAMVRFFADYRIRDAVAFIIAIAFAYQVKNNVLIMFIAMMIYGILQLLNKRQHVIKTAIVLVCTVLVFAAFNVAPKAILTKMTGYTLEQGVSSWSFIAMGLQEDGSSPGWSNGYNYGLYRDNGYNTEAMEKLAKANIDESVAHYLDDKHAAFQFFSRKIASMWTEPTYQGFWINQIRLHRVTFPAWLDGVMSAKGYTVVANIFDYFLLFVFIGTILWLIFEDKNTFVTKSFFILCFVGGFIFHLFWEGKSQYSLTYVIMLIPCAIMGFGLLLNRSVKIGKFATGVCVATMVLFVSVYLYDASNCLTRDTDTYKLYLQTWLPPANTESVLEINTMKAEKQGTEELNAYFRSLLENNGISY
ncbi:MAG: hypothetical protein IKP29_05460 [Pseudobutyrivibrio sp.]|nr:hypothetical protein [Pseudobutyrivibrio sp.]